LRTTFVVPDEVARRTSPPLSYNTNAPVGSSIGLPVEVSDLPVLPTLATFHVPGSLAPPPNDCQRALAPATVML
jgi:hypothetical protein